MNRKKQYRFGKRILAALLSLGLLAGEWNLPVLAAGMEAGAEAELSAVPEAEDISGGDATDAGECGLCPCLQA